MALSEALGRCPVCGGTQHTRVVEQNRVPILRCRQCGQQFVWPVPSPAELAAIYDQGYYRGGRGSLGFSDYGSLARARQRMFSRHLDRLEAFKRGGRVLDVGCATGDFLALARTRGWDVLGIDPSPAREQAMAAGLPIVARTIEEVDLAPHSIDLITFWDVLEHLPNPVETLRSAAALLAAGGIVAATVPDAGGAVARLSGRRWFGYKTAGEHLQFFSRSTIASAFVAAGFDVALHQPVAWSCTLGFVVDRAARYLGEPGRLAFRALRNSRLADVVVDVPQINQFLVGRRPATGSSLAA